MLKLIHVKFHTAVEKMNHISLLKAQSHLDVLASLCRFLENLSKTLVHVEYVMGKF